MSVGMVGAASSDVKQTFLEVKKTEKKKKLDSLLNDEERNPTERVLIFVNTKKNADFLVSVLLVVVLDSYSRVLMIFSLKKHDSLESFLQFLVREKIIKLVLLQFIDIWLS